MTASKKNLEIVNLLYSLLQEKYNLMDQDRTDVLQKQIEQTKEEGPKKELQKQLDSLVASNQKKMEVLTEKITAIVGGKEVLNKLSGPDLTEQEALFKAIKPRIKDALEYSGDFDPSIDSATRQKSYDALIKDVLKITNESEEFKFDAETTKDLTTLIEDVQKAEASASHLQELAQQELNKIADVLVEGMAVTFQEYIRANMEEMEKNKHEPWRKGFVELTAVIEVMLKDERELKYIKIEMKAYSLKNDILESVKGNIEGMEDTTDIVPTLVVIRVATKTAYELKEDMLKESELLAQHQKEISHSGFNKRINKALEDGEAYRKKCTDKDLPNIFKRDNLVKVFKELMRASIEQGEDFEHLGLGANPTEKEKIPGDDQDKFIKSKLKLVFGKNKLEAERLSDTDISDLAKRMKAINKLRAHCSKSTSFNLAAQDNKRYILGAGYGLAAIGIIGLCYYNKDSIKSFGATAITTTRSFSMSYGTQGISWFSKAIGTAFTAAFTTQLAKQMAPYTESLRKSIADTFFGKPKALPQSQQEPSLNEQVESHQTKSNQ